MELTGGLSEAAIEIIVAEVRKGIRRDLGEAGITPAIHCEMSPRWDGGELVLRPSRTDLQEKAVPIATFFHKIVMARERMRVLEQKINNHPKLTEGEKIELQSYITRVYGSFTTFNTLFEDRADWFVGASTEK